MGTTAPQTDLANAQAGLATLTDQLGTVGTSLANAAKARSFAGARSSVKTGEARLMSAQTTLASVVADVQAAVTAINNPTPTPTPTPPTPTPAATVPLPAALQSLPLTLAFNDEFDADTAISSKWAVADGWGNNHAANAAIVGGRLVLTAPSASSGARVDSSAVAGAKPGFSLPPGGVVEFGDVEFPNPDVWATLWTCDETTSAEDGGEVDIVEGGNGATAYHTNYHVGSGFSKNGIVTYPTSLETGQHTLTFYRGDGTDGYRVYLDGTLAGEWTGSDNGSAQSILITIGNTSGTFPATLSVGYVRAWT